jgi:O-antigen/teichoic acid export membrane protein
MLDQLTTGENEQPVGVLLNLNWVLLANVLIGVINLFAGAWFARFLGPQVIGNYATIFVGIQIVTAVMVPGFNLAIIREPNRNEVLAAATLATLLQSVMVVITGGLMYGGFYVYDSVAATPLLLPSALLLTSLIISFWMYLLAAPLEAGMKYQVLVKVRLLAVFSSIILGFIAAAQGLGIYALIVRDIIFAVLTLVLTRMYSPIKLNWRGWRNGFGRFWSFSSALWKLNALEKLALRLDYALVGMFLGKESLGVYFAVRGLVEGGLGFILSPVQTVLYAFYCRAQNVPSILNMILGKGLAYLACGTLAAMLVSLILGPIFIRLLLGEQYSEGSYLLVGLAAYALGIVWFENLKVLAVSRNSHKAMVLVRVLQIAISIILIYPLLKVAGLTGAGISAGISAIAMAVIATSIVSRLPLPTIAGISRSDDTTGIGTMVHRAGA